MQRLYRIVFLGLFVFAIGCTPASPYDMSGALTGIAGAPNGGLAGTFATVPGPVAGTGAIIAGSAASRGSSGIGGPPLVAGITGGQLGTAGMRAAGIGASGAGGAGAIAAGRGGSIGIAGTSAIAGTGAIAGIGAAAGTAAGSGAGGAPGSAGTSGTSGFMPCPATGECKILPLGDSITDGIGSPGGYRVPLFHLAVMNMKKITFLGGSMNGPAMVDGQKFPPNHEGHSGWTIAQVDGIVPSPALNGTPHIILLHIGTNDMYMTPAGAPDRLGTLIDQIVMAVPNALLVVAKIIPLSSGGGAVDTFNAAVPGIVKMRADAGKHVVLVDQFTGFPVSELGDGVHPNVDGYKRMADKWWPAISSFLN